MSTPTPLKWTKIRAGWYETGHEVAGAYVASFDEFTDRWIVSRWSLARGIGYEHLELTNIEAADTLAYAKSLAAFDASLPEVLA